jgi:hypothetical protein
MKPDEIAKCIPNEVARAIATSMGWESAISEPSGMERFKGHIAAGLAAWPGAEQTQLCGGRSGPALILPLSQEGAADLNEGDDELLWRRD